MKKTLCLLLLLFAVVFFGRSSCFANCTISATDPGCTMAGQAGNFWCDTGVDGTSTTPVVKACSGTGGWYTTQEYSQSLTLTGGSSFTTSAPTSTIECTATGHLCPFESVVLDTGDQTIAGIKTFSSFPVTPSSAPSTDYQVANKAYVDAQIISSPGLNYTGASPRGLTPE